MVTSWHNMHMHANADVQDLRYEQTLNHGNLRKSLIQN